MIRSQLVSLIRLRTLELLELLEGIIGLNRIWRCPRTDTETCVSQFRSESKKD